MAWMTRTLQALNTTAVAPCTYNFSSVLALISHNGTMNGTDGGNSTGTGNMTLTVEVVPAALLRAALRLHNLTLEAYVGVVGAISNADILQTVASIIAVDGRHAAYLSTVLGLAPFTEAFESWATPGNISSTPLPFTEDCPYDALALPAMRDAIRGCSNATHVPAVPTGALPTGTGPTSTTGPTTAPQSGAAGVTASSALVVTLVAAIAAAAVHAVAV
jgi:hypothetical protein